MSRPRSASVPGDAERWNARYRARAGLKAERDPDPFVLRALDRLGAGEGRRAVDLACGAGRHALELAARGWSVEAWDVSSVALDLLAKRARARGLSVATREVDLARREARSGETPFDLAVIVDYLDRGLLADLGALLAPGGAAVFVSYTRDHPRERPSPRFRLEPGELAAGLPGLDTVAYEEKGGRAGLLARRA